MTRPDSILSAASTESPLFKLFDKYIKSSDNFLPLDAYLKYLGSDSVSAFSSISCVKSSKTAPLDADNRYANTLAKSSCQLASTLLTINKSDSPNLSPHSSAHSIDPKSDHNEIVLAQKLYKVIISIDYSAQISNLDFIQKSLEKVFEKLAAEYNEFFEQCAHIEPQIYVTVLLWNSTCFQCPQQGSKGAREKHETIQLDEHFVPFKILCHSKRLLKSNLNEMASFIFDKVNVTKNMFFNGFKTSPRDPNMNMADITNKLSLKLNTQVAYGHNKLEFGCLEQFLVNVIRIFSFFNVHEFSTSVSTPAALSLAHHVYITDGLLYANDMIKCLEKIGKSAIVFSFIYYGSSHTYQASNISSGFGYVTDHYLMKFLTRMTNGFFAIIDENLEFAFIENKNLLYYSSMAGGGQVKVLFL